MVPEAHFKHPQIQEIYDPSFDHTRCPRGTSGQLCCYRKILISGFEAKQEALRR